MNAEQIIQENARRNADKKKDYDPVSGLNCCGDRFVLLVADKNPRTFYLPIEMEAHLAILLLKKHGSVEKALREKLKKKPNPTQVDYFWLKVCEERYKFDFEFFAISCIVIEDKIAANNMPFKLNRAQRRLLAVILKRIKEGRQILVQVLKAKQMGFSTLIQMIMLWIQIIHKQNWNSVVSAHDLTGAINIRSMYDRAINEMPAINGIKHRIETFGGTHNIKQLSDRGCRITVTTAEKPQSTRSQNFKMTHLSEEAFYPDTETNNPELIETSIISSMTDGPYTMIVRESTANGEGDYFHNQWLKAKKGESAYEPFFAPWFWIQLYEVPFDGSYYQHLNGKKVKGTVSEFINTLTEEETLLWNNEKECTLENLNWYRQKRAVMSSDWKMRQEYPSNDIEAFQASGNPVFITAHIESLRSGCCAPEEVGVLMSKCDPAISVVEPRRRKEILQDIVFVKDHEATDAVRNGDVVSKFKKGVNKLHVWQYPDTSEKISNRYVVVFDPQKGTSESADYGVIKVFDRYWMMSGGKPEVVALFYGHIDKDITIWIATQIAKWYNNALLVVESNTYDSDYKEDDTPFIFDIIKEYYQNLYCRTSPEKIREGVPARYGAQTNRNTKPMYIATYKGILREKGYVERDEETLNEARTFEEKKDGTTGAKAKNHDDRLMATMIGLYICYDLPIPSKIKIVQTGTVQRTAW